MKNENEAVRSWKEENGVISFEVTSDGTTGPAWIERLEKKGLRVGDHAKSMLRSRDFKPTADVTSRITVLKGEIFSDGDLITKTIRAEAERRKLSTPNAEIACLIREKFSDKDIEAMGLCWIVTMHEPIKDSVELLGADRDGVVPWLRTCSDHPDISWSYEYGFAFVAPQK